MVHFLALHGQFHGHQILGGLAVGLVPVRASMIFTGAITPAFFLL